MRLRNGSLFILFVEGEEEDHAPTVKLIKNPKGLVYKDYEWDIVDSEELAVLHTYENRDEAEKKLLKDLFNAT